MALPVSLPCVKTVSQAVDYAHFGIASAQAKKCSSGVKAFTAAEQQFLDWIVKKYTSQWYIDQAKHILHNANTVCRADLGLAAQQYQTICGSTIPTITMDPILVTPTPSTGSAVATSTTAVAPTSASLLVVEKKSSKWWLIGGTALALLLVTQAKG